ncbi:hypothetical protein HK102_003490 [Quaeritorhiza haematococci]|nr:hypothetical protein HK102_003490 [Quaeritorhiza haematococci]
MTESSPLSRHFSEQGIAIPMRRKARAPRLNQGKFSKSKKSDTHNNNDGDNDISGETDESGSE